MNSVGTVSFPANLLVALFACALCQGEEWSRLANSAIDFSLAGLASGPAERVWYAPSGDTLYLRTPTGKTFETKDFESWKPTSVQPPTQPDLTLARLPESTARIRTGTGQAAAAYASASQGYRSQDRGQY